MKSIYSLSWACVFACAPFVTAADHCKAPAEETFKKVTSKPETVLQIVSTDVAATPRCACPIVKAAISATKADESLQGDIVAAALQAAPDEAASIKACLPMKPVGKGGKGPIQGKEVTPSPPANNGTTQNGPGGNQDGGWFDPLISGAGGLGGGMGGFAGMSSPGSGAGGGTVDNLQDLLETIQQSDGQTAVANPQGSTRSRPRRRP